MNITLFEFILLISTILCYIVYGYLHTNKKVYKRRLEFLNDIKKEDRNLDFQTTYLIVYEKYEYYDFFSNLATFLTIILFICFGWNFLFV